ncbi:hypothetical protein PINS_up007543 [Pythium insidiosum]|nr:hypothetical protein PINS_up007543 [Pythium insidiosum]
MRDMQERLVELEEQLANVPGAIVVRGSRVDHAKAEDGWNQSMRVTVEVLGRIASFSGSSLRNVAAFIMRLLFHIVKAISSLTEPKTPQMATATDGRHYRQRAD